MNTQARRGHLSLVVQTTTEPEFAQRTHFCSHCGWRSNGDAAPQTRVCPRCELGLMLESSMATAPEPGSAFLVLDGSMSICAVSRKAEGLLGISETDAVNRHITELIVPADAEAQGPANLADAVTRAARGDDTARSVTVRPATTFGIRLRARIGSCGPPKAALLVFDDPCV